MDRKDGQSMHRPLVNDVEIDYRSTHLGEGRFKVIDLSHLLRST